MTDKWQPIETAPTDGTEIIGFGTVHGGSEGGDRDTWTGIQWQMYHGWAVTKPMGRYFMGFTPTHWMHLPEPPHE